jgi:hypothetical protein
MLGSSSVAAQPAASQEGLNSMKLVYKATCGNETYYESKISALLRKVTRMFIVLVIIRVCLSTGNRENGEDRAIKR